jgi:hypothetical protein
MNFGRDWKSHPDVLTDVLRAAIDSFDPDNGLMMLDDSSYSLDVPPWEQSGDVTYSRIEGLVVG